MIDLSWSASTWIALLAACAACASAFFAYRNSRIANRALALSKKSSTGADPKTSVHLIDAFRYRVQQQNTIVYVFCIVVENKSTLTNSIVDVELRIPLVKAGLERVAVFKHSGRLAEGEGLRIQNILQIPATLAARGSVAANCCFEVPFEVLHGAEFGIHFLRLRHAEGSVTDVDAKIIMDVINAEHLEKKRRTGVPV